MQKILYRKHRKDNRLKENEKFGEGGREQNMNYSWVKYSLNLSAQWARPGI